MCGFSLVSERQGNRIAPVGFLTPFPPHPSRSCGTPHVYLISRLKLYLFSIPLDQPLRAQTVLGPDCVGFPRRTTSLRRNDVGGIQGEAASRKEASERWKGEGRALSPPRRLGKAKSSDVALVISLLFLISNICVCYPHKMKESQ